MSDVDIFTILERYHTFQNPTSVEKLDRLMEYCGIQDGDRVLDIGCGKGWLLRRMAARYGIEGVGVEVRDSFLAEGRREFEATQGRGTVTFHAIDARSFQAAPASFDIALCIGASFAIGSLEELVDWLRPYVRPGGVLAVGDIFARRDPLPPESAAHFGGGAERSLLDTAEMLNRDGMDLIGIIESSLEDWDHYESQHWRAAAAWLAENPEHPEWKRVRALSGGFKWEYLRVHREALGWGIFVARVE